MANFSDVEVAGPIELVVLAEPVRKDNDVVDCPDVDMVVG